MITICFFFRNFINHIQLYFRSLQIEAPGFTPWFDAWTKIYLQSLPCVEHEFIRHHLGCVFVVSSNTKNDPMEQIRNLVIYNENSTFCVLHSFYFVNSFTYITGSITTQIPTRAGKFKFVQQSVPSIFQLQHIKILYITS